MTIETASILLGVCYLIGGVGLYLRNTFVAAMIILATGAFILSYSVDNASEMPTIQTVQ